MVFIKEKSFVIKKQLPIKKAVLTQKIVARLPKSVHRFYEPLVSTDIDVGDNQTKNREKRENRLNTLLRKHHSSG